MTGGEPAGFAILGPPLHQPAPDPATGELRQIQPRAFYAHHGWRAAAGRRPGPAGADFVRLRLAIPR